jgi:hypothetical protein
LNTEEQRDQKPSAAQRAHPSVQHRRYLNCQGDARKPRARSGACDGSTPALSRDGARHCQQASRTGECTDGQRQVRTAAHRRASIASCRTSSSCAALERGLPDRAGSRKKNRAHGADTQPLRRAVAITPTAPGTVGCCTRDRDRCRKAPLAERRFLRQTSTRRRRKAKNCGRVSRFDSLAEGRDTASSS